VAWNELPDWADLPLLNGAPELAMELNRTRYILSADEVAMIRQAVKQLE
jgi:hypothetical protein